MKTQTNVKAGNLGFGTGKTASQANGKTELL